MQEIDLSKGNTTTRATVMSYGGMRSGKTQWAATWPRPLFLAENRESGWRTVESMAKRSPELFFEPGRPPMVWTVESAADLVSAVPKIETLIKSGEVATVVVDSLTFYADLYLNYLKGRKGNFDPRQHYGELADHIAYVGTVFHNLPCSIIWTCLDKPPDSDNPRGLPLIAGQSANKFQGTCDYVFYHRSQSVGNAATIYEMHSRSFGPYLAGGRDGGALPSPLGYFQEGEKGPEFVLDCTYKTFAEHIELELPKAMKNVKTGGGASPPAQATTPAQTQAPQTAARRR